MFIGHTAFALAAKRARPALPLPALLAATYGPDVIEVTLLALWHWAKVPAAFGSHSIPSVLLGATVVGLAYVVWRRDVAGGALLSAVYASHWVADLFTGTGKPTWGNGPSLGLALYDRPALDFAIETALFLAAWMLFWPARDRRRRRLALRAAPPIALIGLQLAFNSSQWLFGIRSIKGAVSSARGRRGAFLLPTAWLLHSSLRPSSLERAMADNSGPRGVVTLVCLTCGKERFYEQAAPPARVTCDQCGGSVFRQFATPTEPDEATIAQLEEQARSIAYGDPSPDTAPGDVRDLDQR